jgi:hypothetical protein
VLPTANSKAFPRLELLDISTTFILPEALRSCLLHHVSLKHLIVDRTNLLDVEEPELAALSLGRVIAVLSLTRVTAIARAFRGMQQAREANATAAARRGGQTSRSPPQREAPAAADLPARLIIVPYASNIRSFSIGSDTVNHEAMATAFQKGWQAGLVSLKEALDERVGQVRRSSSKGEEYRLVRLRLVDEPRPFYDLANAFDDFCQRFNLVPCTMALLESRYLAVQESACVFCSVPDCCAQGGIVVRPGLRWTSRTLTGSAVSNTRRYALPVHGSFGRLRLAATCFRAHARMRASLGEADLEHLARRGCCNPEARRVACVA